VKESDEHLVDGQNPPFQMSVRGMLPCDILQRMKAVIMSRNFSFLVLSVALGWFVTGCSSHQPDASQSGKTEKEATLTGTYLKQDVTRNGEITNGKDNVRVLDREKMDQSGASDLNQFLRLQGVR
jgi:hypothetical protein